MHLAGLLNTSDRLAGTKSYGHARGIVRQAVLNEKGEICVHVNEISGALKINRQKINK